MKKHLLFFAALAGLLTLALLIGRNHSSVSHVQDSTDYGPADITVLKYGGTHGEVTEINISYQQFNNMGLAEKMEHIKAIVELRHEYEADGNPKVTISRIASSHRAEKFPFEVGQAWSGLAYEMMGDQLAGEGALMFFLGTRTEPQKIYFIYDGEIDHQGKISVDAIFESYNSQDFSNLGERKNISRLSVDPSRTDDAVRMVFPKQLVTRLVSILESHDVAYEMSEPDDEGNVEVVYYTDDETMSLVHGLFMGD